MSMKKQIQRAVRQAFIALGDLLVPATYVRKTGVGVRDPETGLTTYPVTSYPIKRMAPVQFEAKEIDKDPSLATLEKLIFLVEEFPAGIVPSDQDSVTDSRGRIWEVVKLKLDPADACVILAARLT